MFKEPFGYYFYYSKETNLFVSINVTFLEEFLFNRKDEIIELKKIREIPTPCIVEAIPQQPVEKIYAPRRSERISKPPVRYDLLLEEGQDEPDPGFDPRNFGKRNMLIHPNGLKS